MKHLTINSLKYALAACLGMLSLSISACSDDEIIEGEEIFVNKYLILDSDGFSFDADGTRTFTIEVNSSSEWGVTDTPDWITVDVSGNKAELSASANLEKEVRSGVLSITNEDGIKETVRVAQGCRLDRVDYTYMSIYGSDIIISTKGNYAAYVDMKLSDDYQYRYYTPTVVNLVTGEVMVYGSFLEVQYVPSAISDTGVFAITNLSGVSHYYDGNGALTNLTVDTYNSPLVQGISSDGRVMYGSVSAKGGSGLSVFYPCKWVDGVLEILEMPTTNIYGTAIDGSSIVRGGSDDLSVLYGQISSLGTPVVWINGTCKVLGEVTTYEYNLLNYTDWDGTVYPKYPKTWDTYPRMGPNPYRMSHDGKYLVTYREHIIISDDEDRGYVGQENIPVFFDIHNDSVIEFPDLHNCLSLTVLSDNLFSCYEFGTSISYDDDGMIDFKSMHVGYIVDINTKEAERASEWILRNYGVSVHDNSFIISISEDGKTVLGGSLAAITSSYSYVMWVLKL